MLYERLLRPRLFRLDAEDAHHKVLRMLRQAQAIPGLAALAGACAAKGREGEKVTAFGVDFPNPIGLAAGFDKDAELTRILPLLGFGFLEIGSVTLHPQPGNPRPRLFRLIEDEAIINRMGFNSKGAKAVAENLQRAGKCPVPLGINIGLNKDTPKEQAPQHYAQVFQALQRFGDYFVVNVSSPNTRGLREFQEALALRQILAAIEEVNAARKPVLVKLTCDLTDEQLSLALDVVARHAQGVIASNTTLAREGLIYEGPDIAGGLSGAPLRERALAMVERIKERTGGELPIIGVGGIFSGGDALAMLRAGASLVQLYTSMIYRGPGVARRARRELAALRGNA